MELDRTKEIANAIDKNLDALVSGAIKVNDSNNDFVRLKNVVNAERKDIDREIQKRKTPLSCSYSKDEQLLGEAKKQRAYNLLNADLPIKKSELQKAVNQKDWDMAFTLSDCIYSDARLSNSEKYQIDRIYQQAINETKILDLVDARKKLNFQEKELDYILSRIGTIDNADLKRNAQFERARWDIVLVKEQNDRPTKPFAEFIKDIQ